MRTRSRLVLTLLLLLAGLLVVWTVGALRDSGEQAATSQGGDSGEPNVELPSTAKDPGSRTRARQAAADSANEQVDRELVGVVLDRDGTPLPGTLVAGVYYPWRRMDVPNWRGYREERAGPHTTSARDGTFSLGLRRGDVVNLRVSRAGFATAELPSVQSGERVRVVLAPGIRLAVTTLDGSGLPVAGTHLRFGRARSQTDLTFYREAHTDDGGRHTFEDLPGGVDAWLMCRHAELGASAWRRVELPAEGALAIELVLDPGRTIRGRVSDAATGEPVAAARVGMSWMMEGAVLSDAEGYYVLPGWLGRGHRELHVVAAGYARNEAVVGEVTDIDFALAPGDVVVGRIVDAADAPVPDAHVSAVGSAQRDGEKIGSFDVVTAGPEGRFRLASLRRDFPHTLVVAARGHGRVLLDFDPAPRVGVAIDLGDVRLPPARAIAGRVLWPDGRAAVRNRVELSGANADRGRLRGDAPPPEVALGTTETRLTDDQGRFRFPDLSAGIYTIVASIEGSPPVEREVALRADRDLVDLVLRPAGQRTLVVRVEDDEQRPVALLTVSLRLGDTGHVYATTDADGVARFSHEGQMSSVRVLSHTGTPRRSFLYFAPRTVTPGQDDVRLVVREAGLASGIVVDPGGAALGGHSMAVMERGEVLSRHTTDDQGRFRADVPSRGLFDLALEPQRDDAGGLLLGELRGVRAGTEELVVRARRLPLDREIHVRVLDPDGRPVGRIRVGATDVWRNSYGSGQTDETGSAQLTRLPHIELTVSAVLASEISSKGYSEPAAKLPWAPPVPQRVPPDSRDVVLVFREALTVSGVVVQADGTPAARCHVTAYEAGRRLESVDTGQDGRFELSVPREVREHLRLTAWLKVGVGAWVTAESNDVWPGQANLRLRLGPR